MTATTPPSGGGETLAPKSATTTGEALKETFILGGKPVEPSTIRPFSYRASDEDLADLKRRIAATRWPERETVDDDTQGVQLATIQKLADYWLEPARLAQGRGADQRLSELRHRDRRARHPLHPCEVEASKRAAADRHPRLAGLGHRAVEDHRAADRSDRAWRHARRTRSTSSSRRCPATAFPASQASPAGARSGSPAPGIDADEASRL